MHGEMRQSKFMKRYSQDKEGIPMKDIEQMSFDELKRHRQAVDRAMATFEERRRKEALAKLDDRAKELGFPSAAAVVLGKSGPKGRGSTSTAPIKYRNPENPNETWTGIGRRPKWYLAALEAGRTEEDLRV